MFKEISKIDRIKTTYKGTRINKDTVLENYLFAYGDPIVIADAYVNARGPREAINKLLDRCGVGIYKYNNLEDFENDRDCGYIEIEEVNYYDEEDDCEYKYYCKVVYLDRRRAGRWQDTD